MATDLGMSAPAPSPFLSSKTLSHESNQPYKNILPEIELFITMHSLACKQGCSPGLHRQWGKVDVLLARGTVKHVNPSAV
jgi:hypothetical protein